MVAFYSVHKNISLAIKSFGFINILIVLCLLFVAYNLSKTVGLSLVDWLTEDSVQISLVRSYDCFSTKGRYRDTMPMFYRHATSGRNSSYPFISGDTFRGFADFVFDETKINDLQSVKYGDIVFVKGDMFFQFFGEPYNSIKNPFVLVTHNSDFSAPGNFASKLKDEKILAWYGSNPDVVNNSKLIPIPIGLANNRWKHGNVTLLKHAFKTYRKPWKRRSTLLYVNFGMGSNRQQREAALVEAKKFKNVFIVNTRISVDTYLQQVGNSKFVLSPPGNGLDCHRTWEAVLMGAIPIVLSSTLNPLFKNIPAVIIKNWTELTENRLLSYRFSSNDKAVPSVICGKYWLETLLQHRYRHKKI